MLRIFDYNAHLIMEHNLGYLTPRWGPILTFYLELHFTWNSRFPGSQVVFNAEFDETIRILIYSIITSQSIVQVSWSKLKNAFLAILAYL